MGLDITPTISFNIIVTEDVFRTITIMAVHVLYDPLEALTTVVGPRIIRFTIIETRLEPSATDTLLLLLLRIAVIAPS